MQGEISEYIETKFFEFIVLYWNSTILRPYRTTKLKWAVEIEIDPRSKIFYSVDFSAHWPTLKKNILRAQLITRMSGINFLKLANGSINADQVRESGLVQSSVSKISKKKRDALLEAGDPLLGIIKLDLHGFRKKISNESNTCWLPAMIWGRENALKIDWISRKNWKLYEAFYHDTILLRSSSSACKTTPIDDLLRFSKQTGRRDPAGFIFHASRCGSTLVSQMLRQLPESLVLSEPIVLEKIFALPGQSIAKKLALFVGAINALDESRIQKEKNIFIKFTGVPPWLPGLCRLYPSTPWIYVYRDPEEVIRSNLTVPPSWLDFFPGKKGKQRALEKRYETQLDIILANVENASLLLNYNEIGRDFPARLLRVMGLPLSRNSTELMLECFKSYSKIPSQSWDRGRQQKHVEEYTPLAEKISPSLLSKYAILEKLRLDQFPR